jgi:hypothetical protein
MPTLRSRDSLRFGSAEGRATVTDFGGTITSNAGALLPANADTAIGVIDSFAACFRDGRNHALIGHTTRTT